MELVGSSIDCTSKAVCGRKCILDIIEISVSVLEERRWVGLPMSRNKNTMRSMHIMYDVKKRLTRI